MKVVIMCGGQGIRLKPLSTNDTPKPFLKYFTYENEQVSLIERIYKQLRKVYSKNDIYISSNAVGYFNIKRLNITENIIVEPESRDTFPCLCNALVYFLKQGIHDYILFVPSDSYADDILYEETKILQEYLQQHHQNIGLIGQKCSSFSDKYGYLISENTKYPFFNIKYMIEKPNKEKQKELNVQNSFLNCGILISHIDYLQKYLKISDYNEFAKNFYDLPKTSIDYEILEKEQNMVGLITTSSFEDLGTWDSFLKYSIEKNIFNELKLPMKIENDQNLLVVLSKEGLLISNKETLTFSKNDLLQFNNSNIISYSYGYLEKIDKNIYKGYFIKNKIIHDLPFKAFILSGKIKINDKVFATQSFIEIDNTAIILEDTECLVIIE